MPIVFDEVIAEVRPDREEPRNDAQAGGGKPAPTVEELQSALVRRMRLNARVEAH